MIIKEIYKNLSSRDFMILTFSKLLGIFFEENKFQEIFKSFLRHLDLNIFKFLQVNYKNCAF